MPRSRTRLYVALAVLLLAAVAVGYASLAGRARSTPLAELEDRHGPPGGQSYFLFGDFDGLGFDTLSTNAVPWKLVAAALVLERAGGAPRDAKALHRILDARLAEFGLLSAPGILNWREPHPVPVLRRPAGIVTGEVGGRLLPIRVEAANLGCASCHAGVSYDADGRPRSGLWLGLPNTSFDAESYSVGIYRALKAAAGQPQLLLDTVQRLFPEITLRERLTLKLLILPRMARRLAELEAGLDAPAPFDGGLPGLTNGVAALKHRLGQIGPDSPGTDFGFSAIPDLGGRLLRSSLLYDGAYGIPGQERFRPLRADDLPDGHGRNLARIVHFFTVPTMGIAPARLRPSAATEGAIVEFLATYRPPPYPGEISRALAVDGEAVYRAHCADCHGEHVTLDQGIGDRPLSLASFPNRLSPPGEIGTDPRRWQAMDRSLVDAIAASAYGDRLDPAATEGYVAPPLTGLWATAPYLHNNSVPSLWALMNPEDRPRRFRVGGHALDLDRLGVAYPPGYVPWASPRVHDTRLPGKGNGGHEEPFLALNGDEKRALLEYLKLL